VNHATLVKIDVELREEPPDVFQAELDPEALKAVEPGERLLICQRRSRHKGPSYIHGITAK